MICHLGVVVDGYPMVVPTSYGLAGGTLYLHGSVASPPGSPSPRTSPPWPAARWDDGPGVTWRILAEAATPA